MGVYDGNTYISSYSGTEIDQALEFVHTQIAEKFGNEQRLYDFEYEDFCVHNGFLYQCNNENGTSFIEFINEDWTMVKIFDNEGYVILDCKNSTINVDNEES